MLNLTYYVLFLLSHGFASALGERQDIHHMMYETFPNTAMCFRILNGTNQFGCSTSPSGSTGVIHLVNSVSDVTWLLENGNAGPYMAVIPPELFVKEVMQKLVSSKRVSGVLLALRDSVPRPSHMSPDSPCPNQYSSLPDSCDDTSPWNPLGTSFLLLDWPVPLFVVKDATVLNQISQCYKRFNEPLESQASRSLCSLQMTGHMYAAVDTPTCMRRNNLVSSFSHTSYCDPMGDQNLLSLQFPQHLYPAGSKVVLVTARLDAAGMFDGLAPGALSTISGVVTLLTTAHLLTKTLPQYKDTYTKNIMFALVNGEAQDYIGSSRIVYDMQHGEFPSSSQPLRLEHVDQIIDLNQLDSSSKLFVHCFPSSESQKTVETLIRASQSFGVSVQGSCTSTANSKLPPSPLHSFLKVEPTLPGMILTNHQSQYTNMYYNGLLDDVVNAGFTYANGSGVPASSIQNSLAMIAQTLALTLAQVIDPAVKWPASIITSETAALVDELLHCFLESRQCSVFKKVSGDAVIGEGPFPLYVGVRRSPNQVTRLTLLTLAHLTGTPINLTLATCNNLPGHGKDVSYSYVWVGGDEPGTGECMQTTIDATDAVSPAFTIQDYDWTSGNYSTWSESVWPELSLRMFLRPSASQELTTLISGLVVLFLSFVVVYWVNRNASILFTPIWSKVEILQRNAMLHLP